MKTHRKNIHNDIKQFNCIYCNSAYGEKRNLMNHIKRNHPGSELMFRRITPQGEVIMDDKTSLSQVSLNQPTRSKDSVSCDLNNEPGVTVERAEVKDVRDPEQLMRAMAAEAEASREARAKVDLSHVPYSERDSGF